MTEATLPVSFFEGKPLEEGARCEVEIVSVHGDSVQAKYVPHGDADEGEPEKPEMHRLIDEAAARHEY